MRNNKAICITAESPVDLKPKICKECQANLESAPSELIGANQITEIPPAKAEVIEVRQYNVMCPFPFDIRQDILSIIIEAGFVWFWYFSFSESNLTLVSAN
jgi:hypothetical protein